MKRKILSLPALSLALLALAGGGLLFFQDGEFKPRLSHYGLGLAGSAASAPVDYDAKNFRPVYFNAGFVFRPGKVSGTVLETGSGDKAVRLVYENGALRAQVPFYSPARGRGIINTAACAVSPGKKHAVNFQAGLRGVWLEVDGARCAEAGLDFFELPLSKVSVSPESGAEPTSLKAGFGLMKRAGLRERLKYFARPLLWLLVFAALAGLLLSSDLGFSTELVLWAGYVFLFCWAVSSSFTFLLPDIKGTYFDLTQAFRHGQLSLLYTPPPEMLALRDPHQFAAAWKFKAWDLSLYDGRFFLYFGPVPALMRFLSFNAASQAFATVFYSASCIFFFCFALVKARENFFPGAGRRELFLLCAAALLSPLGLYLLSSYSIHVEAVLASSAFMVSGACFFMLALARPAVWPALVAGTCLALAVGSRQTSAVSVMAFAACFMFAMRGQKRLLAAFFTPLAGAAALLLAYNYLRFDNPLEFGVAFQLNSTREYVAAGRFFSLEYVLGNLGRYLGCLPRLSSQPPFLLPAQGGWEPYHPVWSMFLLMPLSLMALPGFVGLKAMPRAARAFFISCSCAGLLVLLLVSSNLVSTTRYESDFAWLFSLAGGLACLRWSAQGGNARRATACALVLLLVAGSFVAFALRQYNFLESSPQRFWEYWMFFG